MTTNNDQDYKEIFDLYPMSQEVYDKMVIKFNLDLDMMKHLYWHSCMVKKDIVDD